MTAKFARAASVRTGGPTYDGVTASRGFTTDVFARCDVCGFVYEDIGEAGVERASKRARRHVAATRHVVKVERGRVVVFETTEKTPEFSMTVRDVIRERFGTS